MEFKNKQKKGLGKRQDRECGEGTQAVATSRVTPDLWQEHDAVVLPEFQDKISN